jgi:hypothetical protein
MEINCKFYDMKPLEHLGKRKGNLKDTNNDLQTKIKPKILENFRET